MSTTYDLQLESTSWGLGQVTGFNAKNVKFADVEAMVQAMCDSEDAQFQGMVGFVQDKGPENSCEGVATVRAIASRIAPRKIPSAAPSHLKEHSGASVMGCIPVLADRQS